MNIIHKTSKHLTALAMLMLTTVAPLSAQQDELNAINKKLAEGNCEGAQKIYELYRNNYPASSDIESRIAECRNTRASQTPSAKAEEKKYSIGDDATDFVGESGYKIAYFDASGKHGFAIKQCGETTRGSSSAPAYDELKIIYQNRYSLGLSGDYWSSTEVDGMLWRYYTLNFADGKTHRVRWGSSVTKSRKVLCIKRF